MRIFITGGCKNGKSTRAEQLAIRMRPDGSPLYYVATMVSSGSEDDARIKRHQLSRQGLGFETFEVGRDIHLLAGQLDLQGSILLDSVTALFLNEMLTPDFDIDYNSTEKAMRDLGEFVSQTPNIVLVSDYIYSDAGFFSELTEFYRKGLAAIDRHLAQLADVVIEACYGSFITHKGAGMLATLGASAKADRSRA